MARASFGCERRAAARLRARLGSPRSRSGFQRACRPCDTVVVEWSPRGMSVTNSLDEIAVFVHVVQAGSFTAAARQRKVPKSTLSRAVSRLEEAVHARLLQRTSRKIALPEAGRAFY